MSIQGRLPYSLIEALPDTDATTPSLSSVATFSGTRYLLWVPDEGFPLAARISWYQLPRRGQSYPYFGACAEVRVPRRHRGDRCGWAPRRRSSWRAPFGRWMQTTEVVEIRSYPASTPIEVLAVEAEAEMRNAAYDLIATGLADQWLSTTQATLLCDRYGFDLDERQRRAGTA